MCCFLEPRYIQNSNPQILEVLKTCSDLSDEQALAVQNLLLSGKTQYGYVYCSTEVVVFVWSDFFVSAQRLMFPCRVLIREPSVWNGETLTNLEILPLYMDSDFFDKFDKVSATWQQESDISTRLPVNISDLTFHSSPYSEQKTKYYFLKKFLKIYKKKDVGRKRRKRMKKMMRGRKKDKRSLGQSPFLHHLVVFCSFFFFYVLKL